jgi:hypothetical protein
MAKIKVTETMVKHGEAMKGPDKKQDLAGMKRTGMSHAAYEKTSADRKADAMRGSKASAKVCPTCGKPM